ncbi:PREDICTED: uncharacterized protein LOC101307008 [Fragaria vesca subsp. vesca]|uniref:uncharacterized protein LOC101307008 n=1 Tax=Fragaria vesca subsp. vesca TaxID=101020 RepID=UPI0002C31271|nr:PREDICTED: uncharacterized protein LOC101307008 [Fragaria vesca subsp. vesca]
MSSDDMSSYAAGGFIFRNPLGSPLAAAAFNFGSTTVPVAKALALRNGLIDAKRRGFKKVEVEGDSKLVINVINGVSAPPWRLLKLCQDIKSLRSSFEFISFKHVFKEANFVAYAIANFDHRLDNSCVWEECVPPDAVLALTFDSVNSWCTRGTSI